MKGERQGNNAGAGNSKRRQPNPEAIAWYVEEAQRLLEDQQRRAASLRTRGAQLAGFAGASLALVGSNASQLFPTSNREVVGAFLILSVCALAAAVVTSIWGALRPKVFAAMSAGEISNYTSTRFLTEPDLWRVQARLLRTLNDVTRFAQDAGDAVESAIEASLRAFLVGLAFSLLAIATLLLELI